MPIPDRFKDRTHAGKLLAQQLLDYANRPDVLVLALPRGGVPVGYAVAQALGVELDVMLVRKLGMPGQEEYAMGAVGAGGVRVIQSGLVESGLVTLEQIDEATRRETAEIVRRDRLYRAGHPPPVLAGRCVIIVDDGIATGATLRAAIEVARRSKVARLVVAVPVGAPDSVEAIGSLVDDLVCLSTPFQFHAVSQWYRHFDQTSDEEVQDLLALAWREQAARAAHAAQAAPSSQQPQQPQRR